MNKTLNVIASASILLSSNSVFSITCTEKVEKLRVDSDKVLVKLHSHQWHLLGWHSKPATKHMYSSVLAAQMSGKPVTIVWPENIGSCEKYSLSAEATHVETASNN